MINHFYVEPNGSVSGIVNGINNQSLANDLTLQAMTVSAAAIALGLRKTEVNYFYNKVASSFVISSEDYFELMLNTAIEIIEKRGE